MRRIGRVAGARGLAALLAGAAAMPAPAAAQEARTEYSMTFSEQRPGSRSAMRINIVYRSPGNRRAKPPALRAVLLELPQGTTLRGARLPACQATDADFRLLGRGACPGETRIGQGTLTAITGFGFPVDPFHTDVVIYNVPGGFAEVVFMPGSNTVLALDRAEVSGTEARLAPPETPGGPPDGRTAVRRIDLSFSPRYALTPVGCPKDARWHSRGTFDFADGTTVSDGASTPCVDHRAG